MHHVTCGEVPEPLRTGQNVLVMFVACALITRREESSTWIGLASFQPSFPPRCPHLHSATECLRVGISQGRERYDPPTVGRGLSRSSSRNQGTGVAWRHWRGTHQTQQRSPACNNKATESCLGFHVREVLLTGSPTLGSITRCRTSQVEMAFACSHAEPLACDEHYAGAQREHCEGLRR